MEKWLQNKFEQINEYHNKCEHEEALQEYLISLKRLLNSIAQMDYSYFHTYEKKILWKPIQVFSEQFMEQVDSALLQENSIIKKNIIVDIENSLLEIFHVYKNIVDGTANSDRLVFTSKAVNTSLYEVSPKICAFYSDILEKLTSMFDDGTAKYSFILYPAICNQIEAHQLFRYRDASGKVVIIHVPERQ